LSFAPFIRVACVEWKNLIRIGMYRYKVHIITLIEDRLRAISVMCIDIDNGNASERAGQIVSRDGSIVQIAEPARKIRICVMPGWPTQSISLWRTFEYPF